MDSDRSYISKVEWLIATRGLHVFANGVFMAFHGFVLYHLLSSIGQPYKSIVGELTDEAIKNGTVLTLDSLQSTDERPIPAEYAPDPVTVVALIVTVGLHVLFYLVQRWSVAVRMFLQFKRVASPIEFACVYPPEMRGQASIVRLVRNSVVPGSYSFKFQRRTFEVVGGSVRLLSFPINEPIAEFIKANAGIASSQELHKREALYGANKVDIPVPPFSHLFLEQLLSPIPIFQLFCSALWMMDEYWKYTIFTLFSICGFEFSTAVQRKKSLETLKSMGGKSVVLVSVLRLGQWVELSSDKLLPGDRLRFVGPVSVVPCDCLIVTGSAVVNEASLTGESVPQMKDAVDADQKEVLDIVNRDRVHCLFSGTTVVRADEGIELIALRTGSESSQGELLRMVEFSQQQVGTDKRDTMYLLLLLLVFAIAAAGYVVYERVSGTGSENLSKMSTHKLTLRVIMIVTSVVPPELPMQMSLSVNTALMALHKLGVFCTEPFRVPMAGTVTHCFFDKTGTLTSDQLKCHAFHMHVECMQAVELVVGGCHSLIEVEGKTVGDPIEASAMEKTGWRLTGKDETEGNKRSVKILHRFHFSSALQRMSCVVSEKGKLYAVVKGSPEVIFSELVKSSDPSFERWYRSTYESLAHEGMRVLALAWKEVKSPSVSRADAETGLTFAALASFACETRADSGTVINALSLSAELPCVMVTGDSALTAVHVARETGVCRKGFVALGLTRMTIDEKLGDEKLVWHQLDCGEEKRVFPFIAHEVEALGRQFDLVVEGPLLPSDPTPLCAGVRVFARMSPLQKERIIGCVKTLGGKPLMCGDGGNDVGALKQAEVGVALLAGFGSTNTDALSYSGSDDFEDQLEKESRVVALRERFLGEKMKAEFAIKKKELMAKQQEWMAAELAVNGNAYWAAIKAVTARLREELGKEGKVLQAKYGVQQAWKAGGAAEPSSATTGTTTGVPVVQMGDASVAAPFTSRAPSIKAVLSIIKQGRCTLLVAVQMMQIMMLESLISAYTFAAITMEGGRSTELQLIGSSVFVMIASVAFTYAKPAKKLSSVVPLKSVFHPAIFLSVIAQVGIHLFVLVYAMSWAKTEMGPEALTDLYKFERDREKKLANVMQAGGAEGEDTGWLSGLGGGADLLQMFRSVPYQPNLLNTVMFLVKASQQVAVLVVNYKGSPWMQGALENKALFLSMFVCALGIFVCSIGYIPILNSTLELLVLPPVLRTRVLLLLGFSTVGTLLVDRLIVYVFARKIFMASTWNPLMATRVGDFVPLVKTCGYIVGGLAVAPLVLGNPIGLIGGIYAFKQYRQWRAGQDLKELNEEGAGRNQ